MFFLLNKRKKIKYRARLYCQSRQLVCGESPFPCTCLRNRVIAQAFVGGAFSCFFVFFFSESPKCMGISNSTILK